MKRTIIQLGSIGVATALLVACGEAEPPVPELSFEEALQLQLIEAQPGM